VRRGAPAHLGDRNSARPAPRAKAAGRAATEGHSRMSIDIEAVRRRLRHHANSLEIVVDDLTYLRTNIPPSPQETSGEDLDGNLDVPTELRAVIAIQLEDKLVPLIRALRAAAEYQEGRV
jgi:hypothetical protein